ncbi:MAG TPA: DUF6602 domain-containing protein [Mycobacteriales bacterium]|nr:DUF6602 domain-containing protein [Mycobacteriales bacterium]
MTQASDSSRPFDLVAAFRAKSAQLAATMDAAHDVTRHGPTIGDAGEAGWRTMLEEFLPRRYAVSTAFVVDSFGHESEQIDIVVHDRHFTPLFWKIDDALFLPAESVYAVFEVKQQLTAGHIKSAGKKVASVRGLHRTSQQIVHAGGVIQAPKPPPRILGGLLAASSSWSPPFGEALRSALNGLDEHHRLDLGCGLQHGAFELPENVTAANGLVTASADVGLAFLAMRLMARLQQMGTVPAVDLDAYTSVLVS